MYIPNSMKKAISNAFYDKTINLLKKVDTIDAEGGVTNKGYETTDTFKGNVSFSNCKKIQEYYGLDYQIDISITTNSNVTNINDLISYEEVVYSVSDVLRSDSHNLIVATKWRQ